MTTQTDGLLSLAGHSVEFDTDLRRLFEDHPELADSYPALARWALSVTPPPPGSRLVGQRGWSKLPPPDAPLPSDSCLIELFSFELAPFIVAMQILAVMGSEDAAGRLPAATKATSMNGVPELLSGLVKRKIIGDWLDYDSGPHIGRLLKDLRVHMLRAVPVDVWGSGIDTRQSFFAPEPKRQYTLWTAFGCRAYKIVRAYLAAIRQDPYLAQAGGPLE